jgi:hypothetical protein
VTSILTEEGSFAHIFGAVPRSLVPPPEEAHEYAWPGFTVKGQDVELPVAAVHTAALTDTKGDRSRRAENISGFLRPRRVGFSFQFGVVFTTEVS